MSRLGYLKQMKGAFAIMKKCFIYKFIVILLAMLFIVLSFSTISYGAVYNLNDYKNHIGSTRFCIFYCEEHGKINLITTHNTYLRL